MDAYGRLSDVEKLWYTVPLRLRRRLRVRQFEKCWEWLGKQTWDGYGLVKQDGRQQRIHRVIWQICVGTIPSGLVMDHLCNNRICANPTHLRPVTSRDNQVRGYVERDMRRKLVAHGLSS